MAESNGASRRWRSLRARIYAVVAFCAVPTVIGSILALTALAAVNGNVVALEQGSVRPMAVLTDLRDMEGDMRVLVWEYLAADPGDRPALRTDTSTTDKQADSDIQHYFTAHGSRTDTDGALMSRFVADLSAWRAVRDNQVLKAADAGNLPGAYAAANGPLAETDDTMAEPLDNLFEKEVAAGSVRVAHSANSYGRARVETVVICLIGVTLAILVGLWMTKAMLAAVGRIRVVMGSVDQDARVGPVKDTSEIGDLGRALDAMLDTMAEQRANLAREQAAREATLTAASVRQRLAEQELRRRAQGIIDQTGASVLAELRDVLDHANLVRQAAGEIEQRAAEADQITRSVVEKAERVDAVIVTMTESLDRVNHVAALIANVTDETKLLALNATIEAVHAGEAGRGFDIVAGEVKQLAGKTRTSTEEITKTVADLEADASTMTTAIRAMTEVVTSIDTATSRVNEVATEQRASVERLDRCVQETIAHIESMSALTDRLERRRYQRVAVGAEATLRRGSVSCQGRLLDLSEGGMLCAVDDGVDFAAGTVLDAEVSLGDRSEPAKVQTRVVRRDVDDEGRSELGLEFQNPSAAFMTAITALIAELAGRAKASESGATREPVPA